MFLPSNITLRYGDTGDFVRELQRRLSLLHCYPADALSGVFDGGTQESVIQFQVQCGIRADGIAGPDTLRRLNGVISGDATTEDYRNEEEETQRKLQADQLLQRQLLEQQRLAEEEAQRLALQQQQAAAAYAPPAPAAFEGAAPAAAAPAAPAVELINLSAAPAVPPLAPPPPAAGVDVLNELLRQSQNAAPAAPSPAASAHAPAPAVATPAAAPLPPLMQAGYAPNPTAPTPAGAAPQATGAEAQKAVSQAANANAGAEVAQAPRGLLGRAMQYASETMQKLASYFESRLPPHVISEVKEIGLAMAKSGMREAPLPTGPEQQRGLEGPGKGQQQSIQRG